MEIIVPERVDPVTSRAQWCNQAHVLRLIFGGDVDQARMPDSTSLSSDFGEDVRRGGVEDLLRCIQSQPIEMKLADPIGRVVENELADRARVLAIEVDGFPPIALIPVGEIIRRKLLQVVAVRTEMIVDHVENDTDAL